MMQPKPTDTARGRAAAMGLANVVVKWAIGGEIVLRKNHNCRQVQAPKVTLKLLGNGHMLGSEK